MQSLHWGAVSYRAQRAWGCRCGLRDVEPDSDGACDAQRPWRGRRIAHNRPCTAVQIRRPSLQPRAAFPCARPRGHCGLWPNPASGARPPSGQEAPGRVGFGHRPVSIAGENRHLRWQPWRGLPCFLWRLALSRSAYIQESLIRAPFQSSHRDNRQTTLVAWLRVHRGLSITIPQPRSHARLTHPNIGAHCNTSTSCVLFATMAVLPSDELSSASWLIVGTHSGSS